MTRPLPEYVRHITDERATNELIREKKHDRSGVTLCGTRVYLVQRSPDHEEKPTFSEGDTIDVGVRRFYDESFSIDHWFNTIRSGGRLVACIACVVHIEQACEIGVWDGTYPDPECENCDAQFEYDEQDPDQRMCEPCIREEKACG